MKRNIYLRFKCTNICNFKCPFCHSEGIKNDSDEEMNPLLFEKIISQLKKAGLQKVKFTGGEPLLCKNLEKYVQICKEYDIKNIGLTTNGSNFYRLKQVFSYFPDISCNISLLSFNKDLHRKISATNTFYNVVNSIKYLSDRKLDYTINMIITSPQLLDFNFFAQLDKYLQEIPRMKLLIPCYLDFNAHINDSKKLEKDILKIFFNRGAKVISKNLNHINLMYLGRTNLIICLPYCPNVCKTAHKTVQTLRLTPDGIIKPCFLDNRYNKSIKDMTSKELYTQILQYIDNPIYCNQEAWRKDYDNRKRI